MANQVVYGIAKDRAHAERIVQALIDAGVSNADISFLASNQNDQFVSSQPSADFNRNWRTEERLSDTSTTNWSKTNASNEGGLAHEKHTKAPEGATTGATTGGIIGGTLGLLAGIGALAIPGLGPFIAAGPIMATLAGIGTGGTIGGILGALVGSGIPEYEAKRYGNRLKEGGVLIAIRTTSDSVTKKVKEILQNHQAEDVNVSSEAFTSTTSTSNKTTNNR